MLELFQGVVVREALEFSFHPAHSKRQKQSSHPALINENKSDRFVTLESATLGSQTSVALI